ncbi:MAG TPA: PilN domain-containing protein [Tepidisphaeraceae bacterium]|jgi:Tfp pilus assembly protein PilN
MSSPNQLSFLPDDYLEIKRQRRTNVICAVMFLMIMSGIGVLFTMSERTHKAEETENTAVSKEYAEAATRIQQQKQMQEKHQRLNAQAELTASLVERVPRSRLLAELTNAKPAGVSFTEVRLDSKLRAANGASAAAAGKTQFEMKRAAMEAATGSAKHAAGPPVPQAKSYDVNVKVMGLADNDVQVAQFLAKLNQSQLLQDVNLVISDEQQLGDAKMRKFEIEMMINPAAEVIPAAVPQSKTASTPVELK